jgi:hypothetical protein
MVLIFTEKITPRVEYIFKLIFKDISGVDIEFTQNIEEFKISDLPKINYSAKYFDNEINISPANLLFESEIKEQEIEVAQWQNLPVFYTTNPKSEFPFDPFSVSFYLVSRYEEYLPNQKLDKYGRFKAEESLAYKNGFFIKPLVNILTEKIKKVLLGKYPEIKFPPKKYEFIPTFDIDIAFAHLEKGLLRQIAGYGKLALKFKCREIVERTKTLLSLIDDPYDNFNFQRSVLEEYNLPSIYFVNLGNYSVYDKNVSFRRKKFRELIKNISGYSEIGIHPSYYSNKNPEKINIEKSRLENILNKKITKSRQHFLKIKFPETYRNLIKAGITDDYSMGYASQAGFRAGICSTFYFYDLKNEEQTNLKIHPFAFMDSMFVDYLKLNPTQTINYIKPLIKEVKSVNGILMGIWHNYLMSNKKDYLKMFEEIIKLTNPILI